VNGPTLSRGNGRSTSRSLQQGSAEALHLEDGFNFGVDGDMRGGEAVDGEWRARGFREMKKAADMIVLVVAGEESLGFGGRELECRESNRLAKFNRQGEIQRD
jgi:hypothetical protein